MSNPTIPDLSTANGNLDLLQANLIPCTLLELGRLLNWESKARVFLEAVLAFLAVRGGSIECKASEFGRWLYPNKEYKAAAAKVTRDLKVLREHQGASRVELVRMITRSKEKTRGGDWVYPPTLYEYGRFPSLFEAVQSGVIDSGLMGMPADNRRRRQFQKVVAAAVKATGAVRLEDWHHDEWAAAKRERRAKGELIEGAFGSKATAADRIALLHQGRGDAFNGWLDKLDAHLGELQFIADTMDDMNKYRSVAALVIESAFKGVETQIRTKNKFGK